MCDQTYRLNSPTVGIVFCDGKKIALTIGCGETVIVSDAIESNSLITVIWGDRPAMIFCQDLRDRGDLISNDD